MDPVTLTAAAPATTITTTRGDVVYTAPTSLTVSSATDLSVGQAILVRSAHGVSADQAMIAGISGSTLTLAVPLQHAYVVGDLVTLLNPMQPYESLFPEGSATPGATNYPTWSV